MTYGGMYTKFALLVLLSFVLISIGASLDTDTAKTITQNTYQSLVTDSSAIANVQISPDTDGNAANIIVVAKSDSASDINIARAASVLIYDAIQKSFPEVERGYLNVQYAGKEEYATIMTQDIISARSDGTVTTAEALSIMTQLLNLGVDFERAGMYKESYFGPTSSWAGAGNGAKPGMEEDNGFNFVSPSDFPTNSDVQVIDQSHTASSGYAQSGTSQPTTPTESSTSQASATTQAPIPDQPATSETQSSVVPSNSGAGEFVGSTESNKYHYPSCRWAEKILPENEIWFSSSEDARAQGYVACKVCKPP
jgi:hypothetical protein